MEQGGDSESLFQRRDIPQLRHSRQLPYSNYLPGSSVKTPQNPPNKISKSDGDEDISIERAGWTFVLILAGIATTLGLSLPVGYNIGVVNTPAGVIREFCQQAIAHEYGSFPNANQLDLIWASIVAMFLVGAAVGSLGGSVLADKIGRKGVLIVCSVLGFVAAVAFAVSKPLQSIELLFIGRLVVGLCSGLTTSVVPMYLTELAPLHLRGSTGVLCPLGVTIGVLFGQIISMRGILGNENNWPYCLAAYVIPLVLCAFTLPMLPESPKYLFVIRNEPHKAFQQLKKLRKVSDDSLSVEIEELRKEQMENQRGSSGNWTIAKLISDRSQLLPLLLVCSLQAGQQLSGINGVFFYSNEIFKVAGLSVAESELATIGSGLCNCFMAVISIWTMSAFNRRFCILVSTTTSAVFLVLLGISIIFIKSYSWVPYFSIVGVLGFVLCYGFGLGPIPYFVASELFEVGPRPSGMALGSMSNWGGNFIIGLLFPAMQIFIGPASFFIFAAIVMGLFTFVRFYLPETRGKDISEIVELCNRGLKSRPLQVRTPLSVPESEKMCANGNRVMS